jgi:hypothetical protein
VPIKQQTYFDASTATSTLNVTVNAGAGAGKITGVFTGNHVTNTAAGAMLGYSFSTGGAAGTTVSGASALRK